MHVSVVFTFTLTHFCDDSHDYNVNVGEAKAITISQWSRADNLLALVEF